MACTFSYSFGLCPEKKIVKFNSENGETFLVTHELTWTIFGNFILNITLECNVQKHVLVIAELCSDELTTVKRSALLNGHKIAMNLKNVNLLSPDPWRCVIHLIPHLHLQDLQSPSTPNNILLPVREGPFKKSRVEQLSNNMLHLFTTGDLSDVILTDGSNEIKAHKAILSARSPVFARMFQIPMKENFENRVVISDIPEDILKELVAFIYTGIVTIKDVKMARSLYIAADKYAVIDLKTVSSDVLKNVSFDNVLDTLALANLYEDNVLKKACLAFLSDNYTKVKSSEAWETFMKENQALAVETLSFLLDKKA